MIHSSYKSDIIYRVNSKAVTCANGCIEYQPGKLKHKYGLISITVNGKRKSVPAHRALWMATHELWELPRCVVIRHKCDNMRCVNIEHLIDGTYKDNAQDMLERGRGASSHKLHTRFRRLTDGQIQAIRAATGKLKYIAQEFGTTTGYVSKIRNMKAKTLV